jgi:cobalt/nickel transport system permease protein
MSGSHFQHFHPEGGADGAAASPLYAAPAGVKLAGALTLIVVTMLLPAAQARWLFAVAGFLALCLLFSLVSLGQLLRRVVYLTPFLLCVALGAVVQPGAGVDWRIVVAKSALCLVTLVLLSSTTPFGAILQVLRRVGVPALLITTMALMSRYLFVLADETVRMRRARTSRTFVRGRRFTWEVLSTVAGRLFVRGIERADRIYDAMCARGWR